MAIVDTWDGLFNAIKRDVVDIMDGVESDWRSDNDNPKYVLMQHVDEESYRQYSPSWYQTSFELRDSVTASVANVVGDIVEVELYHDSEKMSYSPEVPSHGSPSGDIREVLPDIIQGNVKWGVNKMFPADGKWRFARQYAEKALKDLQDGRLKTWLTQQLHKKGYETI